MNRLKLSIRKHLSNFMNGYNHDRYWALRNKTFHSNQITQLLITIYLRRVERRNSAYIGLNFNNDK